MTRSELLVLMVGGMATIAGSVLLFIWNAWGESETERLALESFTGASAMNAPAALLWLKF